MSDEAKTELGSSNKCPGCASALAQGATRCGHCGLTLGEHQRCPHCHGVADVEVAPGVRFVCAICGGVRIPIDDPSVVRSPEQIELLKRVTVSRSARTIWRAIAMVAAGFGLFSILVLWLVISVAHPPTVGAAVAGLAALTPLFFALVAARRASFWQGRMVPLLAEAWSTAAADVARTSEGGASAKRVAEVTRTSEAEATEFLRGAGAKGSGSGPLSQ